MLLSKLSIPLNFFRDNSVPVDIKLRENYQVTEFLKYLKRFPKASEPLK